MKAPAGLREDLRGECRQIIEGRVRQELSLPLIAELAAVYLLPDGQYDRRRRGSSPGMTDFGYRLTILVRPGMNLRPVHFQRVVARPEGQQVPLLGL